MCGGGCMEMPSIKFDKAVFMNRITNLCKLMNEVSPEWNSIFIVNKVNQYYYTGTMQDGVLVILNTGEYGYFVRRSIERARMDSDIANIYPMRSYRDIAEKFGQNMGNAYFETSIIPVAMLERFKKALNFESIKAVDAVILNQRAVKDAQEWALMEYCGNQHRILMQEVVPSIMREGMSECEFVTRVYDEMMKLGFQGMPRYNMFQTENFIGQIAFGTNSLCASSFDGPGGSLGMYAAAPFGGNADRKLKNGDLVFVDVGFAVGGYHTDKTQVYVFGGELPQNAYDIHAACLELQCEIADRLKVGAIPSEVYAEVMAKLPDNLKENFMGFGDRTVKFLGHGIGLCIDEYPVIARGFDKPLEEGMMFAIEPKCGVAGVGAVGVEDTYVVTKNGGKAITGGGEDIIRV